MAEAAKKVAVLFARSDSNYKEISDCDVYDIERDATTYAGGMPVIAHPPCRAWGRLRHFAKPRPGEKELAFFAVEQVRRNGGVLEHPAYSTLWDAAGLPKPGESDEWGFTEHVNQFWWGHKALKPTWLYICGVDRSKLPAHNLVLGEPQYVIASSKKKTWKKSLTKSLREHTPPEFCRYLLNIAKAVNDE
ncbi:MAG: hypothetical protein KME67_03970 [Candidatus Thiodiazotropha sp. (ex Codakia orbicularis)]|nr:hypothetical protein [Candidatus Thiodiazotropha sp. (ex Codakia orbicularis)]